MQENFELDPLFDSSFQARVKRSVTKLIETRYLLIALLIHALVLIVFGGKVLFEAYQRVSLESPSIIAPVQAATTVPPSVSQEKTIDVKVNMPDTSSLSSKLATDKLSASFNIATPDIQTSVSIAMEGINQGSGSNSGSGGICKC